MRSATAKKPLFIGLTAGLAAVAIIAAACGSATTADAEDAAFTIAFVEEAVKRYELNGRDATIEYYNDPAHRVGQWYVFVADENDIMVSHIQNPDLLGTDVNTIAPGGNEIGAEIAQGATETGFWASDYLWPNPDNKNAEELKRTWAVRNSDGYLFGSGYYRPNN